MSSFNNANNVSHQLAAAAVIARNIQHHQQQQANLSSDQFKSHPSLVPLPSHIGSKPNSVGSLASTPSPPLQPTSTIHYPSAPPTTLPTTRHSLFESRCNDNLSLLTAHRQRLSSPSFQSGIGNSSMATITESSNATLESDEASASAAAASMAAAAAFPPAIPAYLQHILYGRCKYIPYNSVHIKITPD